MPKSRYYPRYYGGGGGGRRSSRSYYSTTRTAKKPKVGWEQYTKDQLKDHCRDRQLSTTGNKGDLIRRLEQYFSKKDAEAAAAAEEKKRAAEMADDAAMLDALEMVEQNQKMASSTPQKSDMPSLSQSSISSSQSNAPSPKKLTLTQEQRELIERKRQAALLRRQNSLNSYNSSNLTLSQSSNCSSPTAARAARKPDAVVLSPVVNPYARKPSPIKAESYATAASSPPRQNFQSNPTEPVLPPLPLDSPPIRQYTLDKLSDMQLKVVEAARPPTATALSASNGNVGPDEKCNQSGSFHPIVRVTAAAGTGKTTTLLHLALRCIDLNHKQLTYVTYSKASAVDAQTRIQALLPDDKKSCIEASTLHSCVMRILSKHARENELDEERGVMFEDKFRKLINEVCGKSIENYLEKAYDHVGNVGLQTRKMYDQVLFWIAKSFNSFCIKDISLEDLKDESNVMRHYYPLKARFFRPGEIAEKLGFPLASYSDVKSYKFYADQCVVLWEHIIDNGIRTFDVEMKRAQLAGVRIPGSVLLVDECQDLDECQVDLIAKQLQYGTAIFFVGDAAQTIYSFRGAKSSNYMSLKNAIDLCLNKSWRFGPSIARIANVALFAKEYSPQTNNYLFKAKKQWIPYRIEGARGEEESSVLKDSLLGKSKEVGTITFIARTNYALMFKAMEIMGLGSLVGGQSDDESDSDESKSDRPGEPVSLNLENVPKFHINGKGDMSGLKKWHKTSKEIRQLFNLYETRSTGEGITLPEKEFPDFANKTITWQDFNEDVQNLELNKYVQPIQIIDKYGNNTIKALESFEAEVLDKKYSAEEADIILTTCHSAKGLEWDHVEVCDDFIDLASKSYKQNAPLRIGPEFLSTDVCKKSRAGWQMNLQAYGDDINLLYVACTRAKKTLVLPQTITSFFADVDVIYYLVRNMLRPAEGTDNKLPAKDDVSNYTSLNKKGKNDGRLTKGELWDLYNDLCKPLRAELGVGEDEGILNS